MKNKRQETKLKILMRCIGGIFGIIIAIIGIIPSIITDFIPHGEPDSSSVSIVSNDVCYDELLVTKALYDGCNYVVYCGINETFSMGANAYNTGFVLETKDIDLQSQEYYAYVLIDLENKFSNVSFLTGHINGSPDKNVTLTIYKDNIRYDSYKLSFQTATQHFSIPTSNTSTLRIELTSLNCNVKYGFANVRLFK